MQGGLVGIIRTELSHDDFIETYGSTRSNSISSEKSDSYGEQSDASSASSSVQGSSVTCDACALGNHNIPHGKECPTLQNYKIKKAASMDNIPAYDGRRRNSKLHNIASRLARKSFRMGSKRKPQSAGSTPVDSTPVTPSKWNAFLFKRTHSVSQAPEECQVKSYRRLPAEGGNVRPVSVHYCPTSSSDDVRPPMARSLSHSPSTSSITLFDSGDTKRSNTIRRNKTITENDVKEQPANSSHNRVSEEDGAFPLVNRSLEPFTPEYHVQKKFEEIQENDETRRVAIVTLLKRRKNSLKIKCDQFNKDLTSGDFNEERRKAIRARLKHMRKKLNVVNQCIDEQKESAKVSSAKLKLQLNLELYQLQLRREQNGYRDVRNRHHKQRHNYRRQSPLMSAASCETLGSVEESSVFDDSSSVSSLENKNTFSSSSTTTSPDISPTHQITELDSPLDAAETVYCRSRSVDYAVTSDCDSGFDNGESLSRSEVSLDRSMSKSTGSITSTSSKSGNGHVLTSGNTQKFFYIHRESVADNVLHGKTPGKSKKPDQPHSEVDREILAQIDDFERFAERTLRRLSHKGKLIPLKKDS
ncbi:uncharacterized protein LOC143446371 [Clavelina lepadiformis]|uniref:uncharacterized protein LOC143446371 n=1 Tax=Clavelina lepadiformis TaxID=159417 RepID=UPI004043482E